MPDAFDELDALIEEYDNAEADAMDAEIEAERSAISHQVDLHRRAGVRPNQYKKTFDWQLSIGYGIVLYCKTCYWASSNPIYKYCPYHTGRVAHGPMAPIQEYLDSTIGDL